MTMGAAAKEKKRGRLYVVATPIGNLEDITLRALRVLREADVIACEDTRQTQKLLNHFEIRKRLVSYHEHNERTRAAELLGEMEGGAQVALVSDAGTPLISDPGQHLVAACVAAGICVVPVPGASAVVAALSAAGIAAEEFLFAGFLPARPGKRRRKLEMLARENCTVVSYEAPHRIVAALGDIFEVMGNRACVAARELTTIHEEFVRGSIAEVLEHFRRAPARGELTLIIGPPAVQPPRQGKATLPERVAEIMRETRADQKAALKQAARELGISKREAYKQLLASRAEKT
jgi:16S rRNA (cytidine1402-2'-O)-methyltransferase